MIEIIENEFSIDNYYSKIKSIKNGAISLFLGTVRDDLFDDKNSIESIYLECYKDLALRQLNQIKLNAMKNWNLNNCLIVHRIGKIFVSEKIVLIATCSAHRENAIRSNEFIIDQLKVKAAFWKVKEFKDNTKVIIQKKTDISKSTRWDEIVK